MVHTCTYILLSNKIQLAVLMKGRGEDLHVVQVMTQSWRSGVHVTRVKRLIVADNTL